MTIFLVPRKIREEKIYFESHKLQASNINQKGY